MQYGNSYNNKFNYITKGIKIASKCDMSSYITLDKTKQKDTDSNTHITTDKSKGQMKE